MSTEASALLAHIQRNGLRYFDELGTEPLTATLLSRRDRPRSTLFQVRISASRTSRLVVAKIPHQLRRAPATTEFVLWARPYLGPPVVAEEVAPLQFRGIQLMHERVTRLGDPRLASLRPLDHVPELNAVIMEHVGHPTLAPLLRRHGHRMVGRRSIQFLLGALHNAGIWLREYHALADVWDRPGLGLHRDDFVSSARDLTAYLATASGEADLFMRLGEHLERLAATELDMRPPVGLSHGDYAPRNVFASPEGAAIGFDALPRWHSPVYLDLARFLVGLRSSGAQVLTVGRAHASSQLDLFESAFLDGYFGQSERPIATVHLYQLLVLLDRWASHLARSRPTQLRWRLEMLLRRPLVGRLFRGEAARILGLLADAPVADVSPARVTARRR